VSKRDVFLSLNALKVAGLIRQPTPRRWALIDPVVASALRGGSVSYTRHVVDTLT
jgi:hypothetical protein